ncbi:uncharacterized protein DSM5745_11214 [Aspergillus mulundensis]|uniref:Uncharacterized protein n=1 Tax=Aspergillus mulundensis TaxID=1810919 RepID=A0A3D8Q9K5_9EURO|nr:hypothetical protein DSM5745_11214 [Aspergillus mulundensis]RDW58523.1 hypothetical protein DSM5745_11214 [Aspergillus mulundensis]
MLPRSAPRTPPPGPAGCPCCTRIIRDWYTPLYDAGLPAHMINPPEDAATTPAVFELCGKTPLDPALSTQALGAAIRAALIPHITTRAPTGAEVEVPFYVRLSRRPARVQMKSEMMFIISVLVDFPSRVRVDQPLLDSVVAKLPPHSGGLWAAAVCPAELTPLVWRLRWLDEHVARPAWATEIWSNLPLMPDGARLVWRWERATWGP